VAWGWAVTQRDAVPIDTALDSLYMFYFYRMEYEELTKLLTAARAQRMPAADGQPDWLWYRLDSRCLPAVPLPGGDGLDAWQVHLESGLAVAQAQGWPTEVAYYEARLALMYRDAQNIPDAIAHCQRSIASAKTAEQWSLVALMIHELAYLWAITGAIEQALHTEQESLAVSRSTGSDLDMVNALHNVAAWSLWIGQYKQAEVYFRESVALGDPGDFHYVFGMGSLGLLMFAYGEIKQAIDIAGHIRLIPDIHDPKGRALQLLMSGVADVCTGKFQEGLNFGTRAAVAAGDLFLIIYSDFLMCMAEWGLADDEALLTGMRVGIQKCQAVKNPLLEILFWAFLPVLLHHKKRTEEAVGLVAAIDALHAETLGWTHYWPTYAQFRVVLNQALAPEAFRAAQERGAARGLMSILAAMQTDPLFTTAPASTSAV